MTEEKKAIEMLKDRQKDLLEGSKKSFYSSDRELYKEHAEAIDTILNLIEKLQKENEDLTDVNHEQGQCYYQAKVEIENLREKRDKYYLLISKIRERLQKEYDLYNSKEQLKYSQDIIDVLEELLEEE